MSTIAARLKLMSLDWLHLIMAILVVAGLGVSAYLMWGYTVPGASLSCGGSSGCETVKNSVYSSVMGIPIPVVGLASYLTLLVLIFAQERVSTGRGIAWSSYIALAIFGISLIGVLYSAYLTYLELFVIYAICRWCVTSAGIMAVIFVLSIFNLNNSNQSITTER